MESSKLKMIDQYFEGTLPREQWKEFSTHLSQSSELRKEFRKRAVLDEHLHSIASNLDYPALAPEKKFKISPIPPCFSRCLPRNRTDDHYYYPKY
jgi:hypothetical protein